MTAVAEAPTSIPIVAEPLLLDATVNAVSNGLMMCETKARCVSISSVPNQDTGLLTGVIGVHGKVSGFVTVNMSERFGIAAVEGLLQEKYGELSSQVVDGVGEITNIIVGGIKSALSGTKWSFSNITVPSVIVGKGYQIAYAKGLDFLSISFENDDPEAIMLEDRLMQVSISLLRL
jgi:chemotaxis protein CheX